MKKELHELFPTEKESLFYTPSYVNEDKVSIGASGSLYNYYKTLRKQLRLARIINEDLDSRSKCSAKSDASSESKFINPVYLFFILILLFYQRLFTDHSEGIRCLTDSDQSKYTSAELLTQWEKTFEERSKLLVVKDKKKKKVSLEKYLRSFPSLGHPLGILLVSFADNNNCHGFYY